MSTGSHSLTFFWLFIFWLALPLIVQALGDVCHLIWKIWKDTDYRD